MSIKEKTSKLLENRFGPVFLATLLLCSISLLTRITLLIYSAASFDWSVLNLIKVLLIGLFYDLAAASFAIIPLVIYLWLFPAKAYTSKTSRVLLFIYFFVVVLTLIFNAVSECFFWEEFSVRYNFIAVDYLVYTTEVIGNIRQSYPINTILTALIILTAGIVYLLRKLITVSTYQQTRFSKRTKTAVILLCVPIFTYFCVSHKWKNNSSNQYVNELSGNGMYEFGYAFWHNQLDYDTFYKTLPIKSAANILQHLLQADSASRTDIGTSRTINNGGTENRMNVVLISVESLSAEF
ncbi:hypothetical protein [Pedobacter sp. KBW01]|nr:hypothetical protein [Pedobacter sp. KBW01]